MAEQHCVTRHDTSLLASGASINRAKRVIQLSSVGSPSSDSVCTTTLCLSPRVFPVSASPSFINSPLESKVERCHKSTGPFYT